VTNVELSDGNDYIEGSAVIKSLSAGLNEQLLLIIANDAIERLRSNPHDTVEWVFSGDAYKAKMLDKNTMQIDVTFVFQAILNSVQIVLTLQQLK
jgi:hypothetical protein